MSGASRDAKKRAQQTNAKVSQHGEGGSVWSSILGESVTSKGGQDADWTEVDRELLVWLVQAVSRAKGAVLFGTSRDGTQYHVKLYGGGKEKNFWFAGHEGGVALLHEWISDFCSALEAID